jgi:acid stress chaperone HdeB
MLWSKVTFAGIPAVILMVAQADAQVTIDISKISCHQYLTQRITHTRTMNVWLSGYYAGRQNNPLIDVQAVERSANKLSRFCESHRDMPLMDAVGAAK